ncbi:helix-turn-helix domain-containing protein [Mesorhizobium sp. SP-1A]|uniref:helix-turn-helix domain-containing protein n=1 Tax=Mesorhizobium sp. SP-1A TaxID=3077840 RepID=UPI0028F73B58|nr:helix-turn-helix domain-containing protein [Mesorhizobium sp. SP-1A]
MSWKASAWAKDQRLGSPSAKSILMCLADYADPDGLIKGWASQSDLAEAAEVSERTAREWLQRLEDWGLVERQRQQRPSGARAADHIMLRLDRSVTDGAERCRRLKEGDETDDLPANSAGRTYRQPDAEPTGNQAHPTGNQFRAYKEEPPIEPPLTSQPGAQARERGEDDRKKIEAAFWRMVRQWPGQKGMPRDTGLRAFAGLTPEEREEAERKFPHWLALLKAQRKDHVAAPSTYFGQKLFQDVDEPVEEKPAFVDAPAFGPVWSGLRMQVILTETPAEGPKPSAFMAEQLARDDDAGRRARLTRQAAYGWPAVNRMHDRASDRKGVSVGVERAEMLKSHMEAVPVGSGVYCAWRDLHEARGWPWIPDPGAMRVVYFPAGGPERLSDFEAAVRSHGGHVHEAAE